MKKEEYLKKLKFQLIDFPGEDLKQIEDFYEELIYDGLDQGYTEEEILARFETPEEVAKKIRAEYGGIVVYTAKSASREKKKLEYESSELIHTVKVETENLRIRIRTVEDGPVRVYFKPKEGQDLITFEEKDGIFSFKHQMKSHPLHLNWLNLFLDFNILVLELPMNFAGNLWLKTSNGAIRVSGLSDLTKAELFSNNGKISIENCQINDLQIHTGNAKIDLNNVRGESLDASTGNGLVTAKECCFADNLMLVTQNGAVTGRNIAGSHIVLKTSNGIVNGTIKGKKEEYNISSMTRNGFNNLESICEPDREKKLEVKTNNGQIKVEFAE